MTVLGESGEFDKNDFAIYEIHKKCSPKNPQRSFFMNSTHEIPKKEKSLNLQTFFGLDADLGDQDEKIMFLIPFPFEKI